jgi:hypothetical protein
VAEGYGWVTWRLSIGGKSHNKGLATSNRGEGLTAVMGHDQFGKGGR